MNSVLTVLRDQRALAADAGGFIVRTLQEAIARRGVASMVLSGGKTPRLVYDVLPSVAGEEGLHWHNVHLFWGDERSVPPDHRESNYRMAHESLLGKIDIPGKNIHRIMSERNPAEAASQYCDEIRKFFELNETGLPVFDLVLLGLGPDGHIASIFPGTAAEEEQKRLVMAVHVEKLETDRITMTLPVINNASVICLLVSGREKAEVVKTALEGGVAVLPVHRLNPSHGELRWFADRDAASCMNERNT